MVLKRIGVLSAGKFLGCMYGLLGLLIGGFVLLLSIIGAVHFQQGPAANQQGAGFAPFGLGVAGVIVLPLLYGILGFLGGIISAALFNLVASLVGGLEIELVGSDDRPVPERPGTRAIDPFSAGGEQGPGSFS